ncbi:hypothetical protein H310_01227 [Aphanomyces invadans]|uniref:EDRF1 N-terminal domain-containing protein n=1 Tax=Aphanomyces invadans TaxID=157072 RepID=A0A024UR88_9STRA|nr:hypothetical protein H310_01227 [Aphanomyces invadans]ETW08700.1 hypothetical protein H310_01227 [Aphanomyces invadans]|eukprot:XP_008862505.1 hypothetical protein H310_01227 [Aphanomyces invadans]
MPTRHPHELERATARRVPPFASLDLPMSRPLELRSVNLVPERKNTRTNQPCLVGGDVFTAQGRVASRTHVREVIPAANSAITPNTPCDGVALHEYCQPNVDIVASVDSMKQVFSMAYNASPPPIAVHRVGQRLVLGTHALSESQRISRRYKKSVSKTVSNTLAPLTSPTSVQARNPFFFKDWIVNDEDFDEGVVHQIATDPETGEIFLVGDDDLVPHDEESVQESVQHGLHHRFLHDSLSRVSFPLELTMTEHVPPSLLHPSSYQQLVRWQFNTMEMLLGSNTVIFKHKEGEESIMDEVGTDASTSVTLNSADRSKLNSLACLDTWLDNVMNNLDQTAFCYHQDGHVQGYQMVRTEDLPFVQEPELFDAHAVFDNAQTILSFLQEHCVDEAQTYWLTKSAISSKVHLFQLPTNMYTTADHTVGMLCFQLANSIVGANNQDVRRAQRLYSKCIQMVDSKAFPDVAAQACLALGTTFIRKHLKSGLLALRLLDSDADSGLRTNAMLDELSTALDACETFSKQDGKPKIASLFEIAQRYIPTKPESKHAKWIDGSSVDDTPPPLLDDEAQEKEDFEQALAIFAQGLNWVREDTPTDSNLLDGLLACYYVLSHFATHEGKLGTAFSYAHKLLKLLPSYQYPQVNLLVAKLHLRLTSVQQMGIYRDQFATTERTRLKPRTSTKVQVPAWVQMSAAFAATWTLVDKEQHLNIAVASAMHVGTSTAANHMLSLLSVGRDRLNNSFRATLRDAYVSQTRHFVVSGRHTKGARHAEQGLVLFASIGDDAAAIEMRVLLGEIALRHAHHSIGYHKAIGAFTKALLDLKTSRTDMDNVWRQALQVHILLLLRLAHAQHALYLQEHLSRESLYSVDDASAWTAAQSAVRVELKKCLSYSQDALALTPASAKTKWRVADSHYLLSSLYSSHLGLQNSYNASVDVDLMRTCEEHYEAALAAMPLTFDSCMHHMLLRLDMVKFLLSTGVKIEAHFRDGPPPESAAWRALICLLQCSTLYNLPMGNATEDVRQRVLMLLRGMFPLIEQQVHGCMKALIKMRHPRTDSIKESYLIWIKNASSSSPMDLLARTLDALVQSTDEMRP